MGLFGSSSPKENVTVAPGTTADGGYAPMKREERKKCWEARDAYFGCLDRNNILDSIKEADSATKACPKEEQLYEQDCATSWVCDTTSQSDYLLLKVVRPRYNTLNKSVSRTMKGHRRSKNSRQKALCQCPKPMKDQSSSYGEDVASSNSSVESPTLWKPAMTFIASL